MKTQHDMEQEAAYYDGLERENKRLQAENERLRDGLERVAEWLKIQGVNDIEKSIREFL